jgi:hypothetical protein
MIVVFGQFLISSCGKDNSKKTRESIYSNYLSENKIASINKIRTFRFQGWTSLDYKHLILSSSQKKSFLITLDFYCNELLQTPNILLDQTNNSNLLAKFDSIIVPNNQQSKCRIKSIHPITKNQKNELIALRKNSL